MTEYPLLKQIDGLEARHEEIATLLGDPSVLSDKARYAKLSKEYSELEAMVAAANRYRQLIAGVDEAKEILETEKDEMLREIAKEELDVNTREITKLEEDIKLMLTPKDPEDSRNAILEIRGGTGGDEAALFAGDLLRMYAKYCERKGWKLEISSASEGSAGGFKEVVCSVKGENVYGRLKYESGVHRVQRVPATETQGRVHT